jgi:hypothetical protein
MRYRPTASSVDAMVLALLANNVTVILEIMIAVVVLIETFESVLSRFAFQTRIENNEEFPVIVNIMTTDLVVAGHVRISPDMAIIPSAMLQTVIQRK